MSNPKKDTSGNASGGGIGQDSDEQSSFVDLMNQMRTHSQVFLSKPYSLSDDPSLKCLYPSWHFMKYVTQQKQIFMEFLERNPIPTTKEISIDEDVMNYFNVMNHFISYGESLLKLGLSVRKKLDRDRLEQQEHPDLKRGESNDSRQRFVGGLAKQDLALKFGRESECDHSGEILW